MKPGVKTTEFYVTLVITIGGFIVANFNADSTVAQVASLVVSLLSGLGYVAGRTSVKNNEM